MNPIKEDISTITAARDYWYREAIIAQEMLAQVLTEIGEPVEVKQHSPLPEDVAILFDLDEERGVFVFRVGTKADLPEEEK